MKILLTCFFLAIGMTAQPATAQEPPSDIAKTDESTKAQTIAHEETEKDSVVYLSELGDIPLMDGLVQIDDSALMFDKPAGRIVEVSFITDANAEDVLAYYAASLPPLGWRLSGPDSYERQGEELTIHLEKGESDEHLVHFRLAPLEIEPETPVNKEKSST